MTQEDIIRMAREAELEEMWELTPRFVKRLERFAALVAAEREAVMQAVTDPENQPSQYGTVTLDYHLAKLKEWEDRFERMSDKALAQPEQERYFCQRCGKRTADLTTIHTCTPPT